MSNHHFIERIAIHMLFYKTTIVFTSTFLRFFFIEFKTKMYFSAQTSWIKKTFVKSGRIYNIYVNICILYKYIVSKLI